MSESRRQEIEGIIKRLEEIRAELHQIRVADALAKTPHDFSVQLALTEVERAAHELVGGLR